MNDYKQTFTEEQLDYIREMMNIGAGNAATALQQMLKQPVDLKIPRVNVLPVTQIQSIFDTPSLPVVCVKMGMVGDVGESLFFIVPEEHKERLVSLVKQATPGFSQSKVQSPDEMGLSALAEIGNILAGTYLTAIHDFCGLNIYHTVPVLATDMIQALLDEILIKLSCYIEAVILIENEFALEEEPFKTLLLMLLDAKSTEVLANSLEQARKAYGKA